MAIVLTYKITGSHFNAGVSLAIFLIGDISKKNVPILFTYIVAQIVGVYFGMTFSYFVLGHEKSLILHPPAD